MYLICIYIYIYINIVDNASHHRPSHAHCYILLPQYLLNSSLGISSPQHQLWSFCPPRTKSTMSWRIGSTCSNVDTNIRRPQLIHWRPTCSIEQTKTNIQRSFKYPQHGSPCFPADDPDVLSPADDCCSWPQISRVSGQFQFLSPTGVLFCQSVQVLSFSHFLPRVENNPEKRYLTYPNLVPASSDLKCDQQLGYFSDFSRSRRWIFASKPGIEITFIDYRYYFVTYLIKYISLLIINKSTVLSCLIF